MESEYVEQHQTQDNSSADWDHQAFDLDEYETPKVMYGTCYGGGGGTTCCGGQG